MDIINGLIHTMGEQGIIEHGAVHVEDGKIEWLGTMGQWQERYRARSGKEPVIDAAGGWVMPGIIEAHCHMGITEEKRGWRGTTVMRRWTPSLPGCGR